MAWREVQPDVFYAEDVPVLATESDLQMLESKARISPLKRARLCAHSNPDDALHEMLICLARGSYIRPHRHRKPESALILRGICELVFFDELGNVQDVVMLSDANCSSPFFVRVPEAVYHTYVLRTDFLFFLETTLGPLDRRATEYAPWAPVETEAVESFQRDLQARLERRQPG